MLVLLGERSQQNSYAKHVIGLYLYATGASRQAISVAAHLGIASAYQTIAAGSDDVDKSQEAPNASTSTPAQVPTQGTSTTAISKELETQNSQEPLLAGAGYESLSDTESRESPELEPDLGTDDDESNIHEVLNTKLNEDSEDSEEEPLLNKVSCFSYLRLVQHRLTSTVA